MEGEVSITARPLYPEKRELPTFSDSLPAPYQAALRNNPLQRRPHLHSRERLKSHPGTVGWPQSPSENFGEENSLLRLPVWAWKCFE